MLSLSQTQTQRVSAAAASPPLPFIFSSFCLAEREKRQPPPASRQPQVAVLGSISLTLLSSLPLQIPHLAEGVRIHGEKVTEALRPFHERLEACFKQLREKVEKQYGVKTLVGASFFFSHRSLWL